MTKRPPTYQEKRQLLEDAGLITVFDGPAGVLFSANFFYKSFYESAYQMANRLQKRYLRRLYKDVKMPYKTKDLHVSSGVVLTTRAIFRFAYACDQIFVAYCYAQMEEQAKKELSMATELPEGFSL